MPKHYGISELTVAKGKKRDDIDDRVCWQRSLIEILSTDINNFQ
ncbi:MAG: hypothetical protein ACTS73_02785 [Arsenophonus sp. NEOnobi-MAG3]